MRNKLIDKAINQWQGAYKFGKVKFPEFSRPSKHLFPEVIKKKPNVTNFLFKEHGDWLHPRQSLCNPANLRYCY